MTDAANLTPLETRHVFLDTQVYRKLKFNPDNPALRQLQGHINERRVVLHITDITLMEIERQIHEDVAQRYRELQTISKDFDRWRHHVEVPALPTSLRPEELGQALFSKLAVWIRGDCLCDFHQALKISSDVVFKSYFKRLPPFDKVGGKEFPDAFVLEALRAWCTANGERLYVVTQDQAMARAADTPDTLLSAPTIEFVLERASAGLDSTVLSVAEQLLDDPGFEYRMEETVGELMSEAVFVYRGDLPEGEAYGGELLQIIGIRHWQVVGRTGSRLSLSIDVDLMARIDMQYEDRSDAMYDNEDGEWFGATTGETQIETEITMKLFVEIDPKTGEFSTVELWETDIPVYDRYEYD